MKRSILILAILLAIVSMAKAEQLQMRYLPLSACSTGAKLSIREIRPFNDYESIKYFYKLALVYGRENKGDLASKATSAPWEYFVEYSIKFYNNSGQVGSAITGYLNIDFGIVNSTYVDISNFENLPDDVIEARLELLSTPANLTNIPSDIRLELTQINRSSNLLNVTSSLAPSFNATSQMLTWNYVKGAENYQVEWVYVDEKHTDYSTVTSSTAFTVKEPIRVVVSDQYFDKFNFIYPPGKVFFRVRAVGTFINNTVNSSDLNGDWNVVSSPYLLTEDLSLKNKNWQYVTTFAEEGKTKKVITYYDGTLRARQSLTNLSTENQIMASESKYDSEGRPVVAVMPAPVNTTSLGFRPNLNTFSNGKSDYSVNASLVATPGLTASSEAYKYYSSASIEIEPFKSWLPQANGYAFTQVQYKQDGTGRPEMSSSPGATFRLEPNTVANDPHYTRYYYSGVNSMELSRLFGRNVGDLQHYRKTVTVDANNQASISYADQNGQIVATALTGNTPGNVNSLGGGATTFNINLGQNNILDKEKLSSTSVNTIINLSETTYTLQYDMEGAILPADEYFLTCKACGYDLKIEVIDPDGNHVGSSPVTRNDINPTALNCGNTSYVMPSPVNESFVFTQVGEYTIRKTLKLNEASINYLLTQLKNPPNLEDIMDDELGKIDYSACDITCAEHCLSEVLSTNQNWREHPEQYQTEITNAQQTCMLEQCQVPGLLDQIADAECESITNQILMEVEPGGKYNNDLTWLTSAHNVIWGVGGTPSVADLQNEANYNHDWTTLLKEEHIEYCHALNCPVLKEARKFEKQLGMIKSWEEAVAAGYVSNTDETIFPSAEDPLFYAAGSNSNVMNELTNLDERLTVLYSEPASGLDYNQNGNITDVFSIYDCAETRISFNSTTVVSSEEKWRMFSGLYLGQRAIALKNLQLISGGVSDFSGTEDLVECHYVSREDDFYPIVPDPVISLTIEGTTEYVQESLEQHCTSACIANADIWLGQILSHCNITTMTQAHKDAIKNNLTSLCNGKCGQENPLGILIEEYSTLQEYIAIEAILNSNYSCSMDFLLINDPYTYMPTGTCLQYGSLDLKAWNLSANCDYVCHANKLGTIDPSTPNYIGFAPNIDFSVSAQSNSPGPFPGICNTNFYVEIRGYLSAPVSGQYQIVSAADNLERIKIDGITYVANLGTNYLGTDAQGYCSHNGGQFFNVTLSAGLHEIEVDWVQGTSAAQLQLQWQLPNSSGFNVISSLNFARPCRTAVGIDECTLLDGYSNCSAGSAYSPSECADQIISGLSLLNASRYSSDPCPATISDYKQEEVYTNNGVHQTLISLSSACNANVADEYILLSDHATNGANEMYEFGLSKLSANVTGSDFCELPTEYLSANPVQKILKFYAVIGGTNVYVPKDKILSIGDLSVDCQYLLANTQHNNGSEKGLQANLLVDNFQGTTGLIRAYLEVTDWTGGPDLITWKVQNATLCDYVPTRQECEEQLRKVAISNAHLIWEQETGSIVSEFLNKHFTNCFGAHLKETFTCSYATRDHHYTLYYYDQAGNLLQTVPPEGVKPLNVGVNFENGMLKADAPLPAHRLVTTYKYNTLGQLLYQYTPDSKNAYFFYDSKGRLRLSQNAKQSAASISPTSQVYSYTRYDAQGRMTEVGQLNNHDHNVTWHSSDVNKKDALVLLDNQTFPDMASSLELEQITVTQYDYEAGMLNTRGRVATSIIKPTETTEDGRTNYSYDIHGNVNLLKQTITGFGTKTISYTYDLISGKTNKVYYQKGQSDMFVHRYVYDADNRLLSAHTSTDDIRWEEEAHYFYYKYGPMARVELGHDKVQAQDFYYTLNGWIKGVNMPGNRADVAGYKRNTTDPGSDGIGTGLNQYVGQDEYAYTLGYYENDYIPVGAVDKGLTTNVSALDAKTLGTGLYNGNISWMITDIYNLGYKVSGASPVERYGLSAYSYQYDQLNRLSHAFNFGYSTDWTRSSANINESKYDAWYSYDANGNIKFAKVNGAGTGIIDNLTYNYAQTGEGRVDNKLIDITDPSGTSVGDITNGYYDYDAIGSLTYDSQEGIDNVLWTLNGKVKEVQYSTAAKAAGKKNLRFTYNALGERVKKEVLNANGTVYSISNYIHDASGNTMFIHNVETGTSTTLEYTIYGTEQIGLYKVSDSEVAYEKRIPYLRTYSLNNHLGNVLAVVTGQKQGVDTDANGKADFYIATLKSASDYYPFGWTMPGRSYSNYRFGFNNKENDNEICWQDYGMRMYNTRLARFFNVDPITSSYPELTPYQFASNTPVQSIDLDGLEEYHYTLTFDECQQPQLVMTKYIPTKTSFWGVEYVPEFCMFIHYNDDTYGFSEGGYGFNTNSLDLLEQFIWDPEGGEYRSDESYKRAILAQSAFAVAVHSTEYGARMMLRPVIVIPNRKVVVYSEKKVLPDEKGHIIQGIENSSGQVEYFHQTTAGFAKKNMYRNIKTEADFDAEEARISKLYDKAVFKVTSQQADAMLTKAGSMIGKNTYVRGYRDCVQQSKRVALAGGLHSSIGTLTPKGYYNWAKKISDKQNKGGN